jgi:hypothetical protein
MLDAQSENGERNYRMRISVDVGYVDVDVDMGDYDSDDLIGELESRGFEVLESNDPRLKAPEFTADEFRLLESLIANQNPRVGTELYFIREKLFRA